MASHAQDRKRATGEPQLDLGTDPLNRMLDLWEQQTRLLVDHGLEPQMSERLKRLLPRLLEASDRVSGWHPDGAVLKGFDAMTLTQVRTIVAEMQRFKLTGEQHAALARLHTWCREQLVTWSSGQPGSLLRGNP